VASTGQGLKSLFLAEFVSAFFLSMRYFFAPKKTLNYPFEKGPLSPRFLDEDFLQDCYQFLPVCDACRVRCKRWLVRKLLHLKCATEFSE